MSLILYHGSNRNFQAFQIEERLVQRSVHDLAEGLGIYLAENPSFVKSYGHILYEVELNEADVFDFTDKASIVNLIEKIANQIQIPLTEWFDVHRLVESLQNGQISVTKCYEEIILMLESNEAFYNHYEALITYEADCLFERLKESFFEEIKDVLKYYDPDFGQNIYICIKHPEKLVIKNR